MQPKIVKSPSYKRWCPTRIHFGSTTVHPVWTCKVQMYTNDVQIHYSYTLGLVEDATERINEDLCLIASWSMKNKLMLNSNKTQAILISRSSIDTQSLPKLCIEGLVLPYVSSVKNLGVIFNENLNWGDHIAKTVSKVYGSLRALYKIGNWLPFRIKTMLIKTLLFPIIFYAYPVFCDLDSYSFRKLNVAINRTVRYAYNIGRREHISGYVKAFLGMELQKYLQYKTLTFLFTLKENKVPEYLFQRLQYTSSSERSRSFVTPISNYTVTQKQFFVYSIRLWNSLPLYIRRSSNIRDFEKKLKQHFCT